MLKGRPLYLYIVVILLFVGFTFWAIKYSNTIQDLLQHSIKSNDFADTNANTLKANTHSKFSGNYYEITYPVSWKFEGPMAGPVTGFPEFAKLVSPSGDLSVFIGLRGDDRFEFSYDDMQSRLEGVMVRVGERLYTGEEEYFSADESAEYSMVSLGVELEDARKLGFSNFSKQVLLPMKIQILYRFPNNELTYEQKLEFYNKEKEQALKILETFKFK